MKNTIRLTQLRRPTTPRVLARGTELRLKSDNTASSHIPLRGCLLVAYGSGHCAICVAVR